MVLAMLMVVVVVVLTLCVVCHGSGLNPEPCAAGRQAHQRSRAE